MLTPKALLPIRRFPIFHHIRSLTGWTVNRLYDHHRRSFLGLDVYDTASPLVCIYQEGLRKSTNLGHYPSSMLPIHSRPWPCFRAIGSSGYLVTIRGNTVFGSMINGGYVLSGAKTVLIRLRSRITTRGEITMARTPIHPGEILGDELREIGVSAAELARLIQVPANRVSQILSGKRHITADTALRLGRWFGTGPHLWLNLQQAYDLDLARQQRGEALEAIAPRVPVAVTA